MTPNLNVNVPGSSPTTPAAATLFSGAPNANTLGALVSQHRLLELSRFGLRGYDLAQHMLTQQGAVSKLLGEFIFYNFLAISFCAYDDYLGCVFRNFFSMGIFLWSNLPTQIDSCRSVRLQRIILKPFIVFKKYKSLN